MKYHINGMQFGNRGYTPLNDPLNTLSRENENHPSIYARAGEMYMYNIHTVKLENTLMTPITHVCVIILGKNWGGLEIHTSPLIDPVNQEVLL